MIRDTMIGTRHKRQEKEAEMAGAALVADGEEEDTEDEDGDDDDGEVEADRECEAFGMAWLEEHVNEIFRQIDCDHME